MSLSLPAGLFAPLAAAALAGVAACSVGPNFTRPAAPEVSAYTAVPLVATTATPEVTGGQAQQFALGGAIAADWWTLFHSKPLDALIERSISSNPDLKAAQSALSVARENVLAQRGAFYPAVAASFSASRQRQSGEIAPTPNSNLFLYNLFTPEVSISYLPDVFGLNRRTAESLQAQEQEVRFQMLATYTTLTSNVVVAAIQDRSLQQQIDATRRLIDINAQMLRILEYQYAKGYASGVDVAAQKSQLAQVTAALPPLLKQAAQTHDLLADLTGRFPAQAPQQTFELASLQLPEELPLSLPSVLVRQRPDVLQAEENLHDASARIGIAVANRLPNLLLSADAGNTALALNQLFTAGTGFWEVGADVTAPVFQGGMLLHAERAAKAAYRQAAAQYRSAVFGAFQNVADTLSSLQQDAEALRAAADAVDAATATLQLAQRQVQDGYTGDLGLLNAEQGYQQSLINLVQAQASRYADTAALFQALGGGWWHRPDLDNDKR